MAGSAESGHLTTRLQDLLRCPNCGGEVEPASVGARCRSCDAVYRRDDGVWRLLPPSAGDDPAVEFFNEPDAARYGRDAEEMTERWRVPVERFLRAMPESATVVEIGSGNDAFDDCHPGYVAVDVSFVALRGSRAGCRIQADAQRLPFADGVIDGVFTVASLEHVPDPAAALMEIHRCLRPGGRALVFPAWYVRPWTSRALHIRPFRDLGLADRFRKLSIPIRNGKPYQFLTLLPGRLRREHSIRSGRPVAFEFRALEPNLSEYVTSDSDAFASMDAHAASAFFVSRGYRDLHRSSAAARLLYGFHPVEVEKPAPR